MSKGQPVGGDKTTDELLRATAELTDHELLGAYALRFEGLVCFAVNPKNEKNPCKQPLDIIMDAPYCNYPENRADLLDACAKACKEAAANIRKELGE